MLKKGFDKETQEDESCRNEVKYQLLESKSHEIRTYMTRIISMTDLTLMTELTKEQQDYLEVVKSSTRSLLQVLNDILDYSKVPSDKKTKLEQVPFNIHETIHEVMDMFQVASKQKNVYVRLNRFDKKIPKYLIGNSKTLKQTLLNLVGNSVRFSNGEVIMDVDLEELDESKMLSKLKFLVSDTNKGNDPIIKEFRHTELTSLKKLVELMNGEICFDSTEGIGSRFCFTAVFGVQGEGGSYERHNDHSGGR